VIDFAEKIGPIPSPNRIQIISFPPPPTLPPTPPKQKNPKKGKIITHFPKNHPPLVAVDKKNQKSTEIKNK
jgi:hypothetical protein